MRLRSTLNSDEQPDLVVEATRYRMRPNQQELVCGFCNESYFVDDMTFERAMSAMEEGIDHPFSCDECEQEYEELSH